MKLHTVKPGQVHTYMHIISSNLMWGDNKRGLMSTLSAQVQNTSAAQRLRELENSLGFQKFNRTPFSASVHLSLLDLSCRTIQLHHLNSMSRRCSYFSSEPGELQNQN